MNGGIGGETISTVRAIQTTLGGTPTILIDESGTGCGDVDVNTTDYLVLIYCAPSMVATYPLSGGTATGCPALRAGASFGYTANAAAHVEGSTGGTFSIESITSTCMTGSFSATFAGGQVSGNFAAIACP